MLNNALRIRAAVLVLAATPSVAPAQQSDSTRGLFSRRDVAFMALFSAASIAATRLDSRVAQRVAQTDIQERRAIANTANVFNFVNEKTLFLAGVAGYGIGRLAARSDAPITDVSLHVAEAVLISTVFNTGIRGTLGRSRPFITNGEDPYDFHFMRGFKDFDYRAFPSVHASASFAAATVLTSEARNRAPAAAPWVGIITYGLASMPGLARIYKGKHWTSDIIMGAFVGTMTGLKVMHHEHSGSDTWVKRHLLR
jgi:membrane-associated phospholipid phosphatase